MYPFKQVALGYLLLGLAAATAHSPTELRVHQARTIAPSGFVKVGPASPEQTLQLRFALAQTNPTGLIDALYKVSDPKSPAYGQFLSKEEVESFVTPTPETLRSVNEWLASNNLTSTPMSPSGDWIGIEVSVSKANELFNADFSVFSFEETGVQAIRTLSYSLPANLQSHVDFVHPTVSFPNPQSNQALPVSSKRRRWEPVQPSTSSASAAPAPTIPACNNGTIPACLQAYLDIPTTPAVNKSTTLGVTGFYGNEAHYSYLEVFLETFRPDLDPKTNNFTVVGIDGGSDEQNPYSVIEGDLDLQYTIGVATGVNITEYFVGPNITDGVDGFLDEANFLAALDVLPQVLTTSYALDEGTWDFDITNKICQIYAQLGARGTSMLFASGDAGPGCGIDNITDFGPLFPASCPYVTAVGGTMNQVPESAWIGSSGGFSNYFARPSYQDTAVPAFLSALGNTNAGRYNATGRGIPDISAQAYNFTVYVAGYYATYIQGTSAASPTVASMVALVNDRLSQAGRPQMGWLNPWLYSTGLDALADITTGNSSIQCSDTDPVRSWEAVEGWDPVTGLGTPNFKKLLSVLNLDL